MNEPTSTGLRDASDERYRLLFEANPQPTWVFDSETLRFLEVNEAAVRRYGYSREEFLERTIVDIGPEEDVSSFLEAIETNQWERPPRFGWRHRTRDGDVFDVEIVAHDITFAGRPARLIIATDVTERRRAQAALSESERRYREMVESLSLVAIGLDRSGRVTLCNDSFLRLTGWRRDEVVGADWFSMFVPCGIGDEMRRNFERHLADGWVRPHFENDILDRDGNPHTIRWSNTLLRDPDDNVVGTMSMGEDITERRRAEQELRASEERYRRLFERNLAGVFRSTIDGEILECNEAFVWIYGYASPEELKLASARSLYESSTDRESFLKLLSETGAVTSHESRGRRKDGTAIWLLENTHLVYDGGGLVIEGTIVDITEMKRAAAERAQHEATLRRHQAALLELARSDALRRGDLDAVIQKIIRTAAEVLGVDRVTVWFFTEARDAIVCVGSHTLVELADLKGARLEATDHPAYFAAIEAGRALAADDAYADARTKELRETYLNPFGVGAILDAPIRLRGETVGIICHDHMGGERAWAPEEANFAGSLADLLSLLIEEGERRRLESELKQAQKMEAVGRLAGGIAHDFNNLLTVILGRADLLAARLDPDSPLMRDVDLIRNVGRRAASLTGQLLAFSRKQVAAPRVLDVNALVRDLEAMLHRLIGEDINLVLSLADQPLHVKADPVQVEQVLLNLVINARDAMPDGGLVEIATARIDVDEGRHRRRAELEPGRYLLLSVRDEGIGMDAGTLSRVFEPFFTTKEPGRGTGLGLATVYGILKQHGGHVEVESEVGRGSVFRIFFPLAAEEDAHHAVVAAEAPACGTAGTILVVEDEGAIRELVRELLEQAGFSVLDAAHGAEALEVAREHPGRIDLVLSDVVMPQMGGPELVSRLAPERPGLKVIFMSGYTNDRMLRKGVWEGDTPFLQKPFTSDALLKKVIEVLGD